MGEVFWLLIEPVNQHTQPSTQMCVTQELCLLRQRFIVSAHKDLSVRSPCYSHGQPAGPEESLLMNAKNDS